MAMAISDSDVKAIIDTERDTSPFITTAQLIVDEDLIGNSMSTERLDQIVLYLAAHFVCVTEERGGVTRSRLGDADESYRGIDSTAQGLSSTRYGQQAMILDSTGLLAAKSTNGGLKAIFEVVG
ncbi:MAG: hypothetical protein E6Q97_36495 [Desulfurellales bacterium]|nr:MAG: hypothetical protein E6Q97_36495 [Desulfurellales bacterium]